MNTIIAVTGATGQLGRLVINHLLGRIPSEQIVAIVRDPSKAGDIASRGVTVRKADYNDPAELNTALAGVTRLLLISSNEIGHRFAQHSNVIAAAKRQRINLFVYTSLLRAGSSPLDLAAEHVQTENALNTSGLPCVILRNGWYTENYLGAVQSVLARGVLCGCARDGRISSATRSDYAKAAAKILLDGGPSGQTFELAGDTSYTLTDLAAEISKQSGKHVTYQNLSESDYRNELVHIGLPEGLATSIANWDTGVSQGALFDEGHQLSKLIGSPTTSLSQAVKEALDSA